MVFSKNVDAVSRTTLANILGVTVVSKHDKYLGLPMVVGRSRKEVFDGIKEQMWKKLQNWSSKQLSQRRHMVLMKSVLQSLPTYVMSCFLLPNSLLGEIESMMAAVFWSCRSNTKIHWLSWDKICKRKEAGGVLVFAALRNSIYHSLPNKHGTWQ
ncbi:UNVERIFIED_CONTAM: hypothetical protein Slati_4423700 [Sesamum latifolium]|uniref:Reverse transcriptase n=1 Tax=Sesamum latifolium TaxID=2727402 RepID=A0AAW2SR26_9LAMI